MIEWGDYWRHQLSKGRRKCPNAEFVTWKYKDINEYFPHQGSIDEVKLYECALSAIEIKKNMNSYVLAVDLACKLDVMWGTIKRNRIH